MSVTGHDTLKARRSLSVDGKSYDALMVPMRDNDDAWIASVLSYVRSSFGNRAPAIAPEEVRSQP